jgi:hypothetical protein
MRRFIEDIVAIAILVFTEAWFLHGYFSGNPEFEPAIGFIAALGAMLAKDPVRAHFSPKTDKEPCRNHDKELFGRFLEVFPPDKTIRFLKDQNFGDSFHRSSVVPLYAFVETWDSVEKEFLDKTLEKKRRSLYAAASQLATEISRRTAPLNGGQLVSVYTDQQRSAGPRPKFVIEDARILNANASEFLPVYEDFIRSCRETLNA